MDGLPIWSPRAYATPQTIRSRMADRIQQVNGNGSIRRECLWHPPHTAPDGKWQRRIANCGGRSNNLRNARFRSDLPKSRGRPCATVCPSQKRICRERSLKREPRRISRRSP